MRTLLVLILLSTVAVVSCSLPVARGANGSSFSTAVQYNDYIIERQSSIINHILDISKTAESDLDSTEALLNGGVKLVDSVLLEVKGLSAFNGDSTFRNTAVSMFGFYRHILDVDYREMVALRKKGEDITAEEIKRLQEIQQNLQEEETERDKHLHNAQQEFAERNGMRLAQNALQQKIDGVE
jgi:hypothetical protein